jgi:hypothetical protein
VARRQVVAIRHRQAIFRHLPEEGRHHRLVARHLQEGGPNPLAIPHRNPPAR